MKIRFILPAFALAASFVQAEDWPVWGRNSSRNSCFF